MRMEHRLAHGVPCAPGKVELDMDVCRINYWIQLKTLKLFSLERRTERYMILFLYKIMIKDYPKPKITDFNMKNKSFNILRMGHNLPHVQKTIEVERIVL